MIKNHYKKNSGYYATQVLDRCLSIDCKIGSHGKLEEKQTKNSYPQKDRFLKEQIIGSTKNVRLCLVCYSISKKNTETNYNTVIMLDT